MDMTSEANRASLTPIQQGMLFHYLTDPESGIDVEQVVWDLNRPVDAAEFEAAWRCVVRNHEAFRTTYHWAGPDASYQEAKPTVDLPFTIQDWRDKSQEEAAVKLDAYLETDRRRPVSLETLPNTRVLLIRLSETSFRCVWTFPHIMMDGRSIPVILQEVADRLKGRTPTSSQEELSTFGRYTKWIGSRDAKADTTFWSGKLSDVSDATAIPVILASDGDPSSRLGRETRRLSPQLSETLRKLSKEHSFTVSTIVHGAWGLLLSRYGGTNDVVFGSSLSGRDKTVDGAQGAVGVFITTFPARVRTDPEARVLPWLSDLRSEMEAARPHAHASLATVQQLTGLNQGQTLLDSLLIFDHGSISHRLGQGNWDDGSVTLHESFSYPITVHVFDEPEMLLRLAFDRDRLSESAAQRMLAHLETLLEGLGNADEDSRLRDVNLLTVGELDQQDEWNQTEAQLSGPDCLHTMFEAQVDRTPDAVALADGTSELTYRELEERANRLAHSLIQAGVGPDVPVGICTTRSTHMLVALLGTLKAGGAYVPMDPAYPTDRIALMIEDSGVKQVLTEAHLIPQLSAIATGDGPVLVAVDQDGALSEDASRPATKVSGKNLAYVIFTSGSTGRPKGVEVEHRNVVNFFAGMDTFLHSEKPSEKIGEKPGEKPGAWLAVTSLAFDISVLELFWTLSRGFKVVLYTHLHHAVQEAGNKPTSNRPMDMGLFYFSSDEGNGAGSDAYRLLLEGAKFADKNGFKSVWTPERHFHAFGGLYPNPAVTGSAIAAITENVHIRTGSLVLPLHHPIRVAEDWAVIDNISDGRVGLAFASGWHPEDFCIRADNYENRKAYLYEAIDTVRALWRGETLTFPGPKGDVQVRTLPRPVQAELPVWVTTAGSIDSYVSAGKLGTNVLTHLLGQNLEDLAEKIAAYRAARAEAGHSGPGQISIMLHTFVGDDDDDVRELVREPMVNYLRSAASLVKGFAGEWEAYSKKSQVAVKAEGDEFSHLSEEDTESLLNFAFERYYETSGLFGSQAKCLAMVESLKGVGIDEIACLIDFGVDQELVLEHLEPLAEVLRLANPPTGEAEGEARVVTVGASFSELVEKHDISHLQCTPSMMQMLQADPESKTALGKLSQVLVGGEALPSTLAAELSENNGMGVLNMYGPTETTIWSSVFDATRANGSGTVPIGNPILNTDLYVVDPSNNRLPVGVPGELLIGGKGVVRGYHERPDLTAERFISHPWSDDPTARLYRTGDQVRFREDGVVEFLGRIDHQVKIRGHRIELGEIEAALLQRSDVKEAVVVARVDSSGTSRLSAYVVRGDGANNEAEFVAHLRVQLASQMPDVMVPSTFTVLEALPLTPNGKIDRKALPSPEQAVAPSASNAVAPTNPLEETIATIWSEQLGVPDVGIDQNFFDLGGHSLLAVQVHLQIQKALDKPVSITDLFRFPTVRSLSTFLSTDGPAPGQADASLDRAARRRKSMGRRRLKRQNTD